MAKAEVEEQTPGGVPEVLDPEPSETPDAQPEEPETPTEAPEQPSGPDAQPADEEGDEEGDEGTTGAAQAKPQKPSDTAQMKAFDSAQRKASNYVRGVVDVLGEAAQDLSPCPRCADFLPGFIVSHAIRPVTPEQRVAVKVSMGEDAEPQYVQHPESVPCPTCEGWGQVLTGSHVRNQDKVKCPNCQGRGFVGPLANTAILPSPEPVAVAAGENGTEPEPGPPTDPWGRMKGDPLYGVMPGYES